MRKRLAAIASLLFVLGCSDVPTQPVTTEMDFFTASIVGGRPGRFAMGPTLINASGGSSYWEGSDTPTGFCGAVYVDVVQDNWYVGNDLTEPESRIHITENEDWVIATCQFTDESVVYEANAEVGVITDCAIALPGDRFLSGGTGTLTAAANNAKDLTDGGNAMIRCKFKNTDAPPQIIL